MNFSKIRKSIQFTSIGITTFAISKFNAKAGQRYLIQELGKLPGIPTKMNQILSTKFDQSGIPHVQPEPLPLGWVRSHIEKESPRLALELETIDDHPLTASIGQVHRATLKDGKEVAIKIRYPGIENEIQEQLDLILGVFNQAPIPSFMKINTQTYRVFLSQFFKDELNYLNESKFQNQFKTCFSSDQRFVIPEVYPHLSSPSILVQSFEESEIVSLIHDLNDEEKRHYFNAMKEFFIQGIMEHGLVHTDLHEHNWGIRRSTRQIVIYDFGATLQLSSSIQDSLRKLSTQHPNESFDYLSEFESIGFDRKKMESIKNSLPQLCEIIFEPLINKSNWNPEKWSIQKRVNELLGSDKWAFRTSGAPWFLFLIRGLNGWSHALNQFSVPESPMTNTKLRIRIMENSKEKVYLEFPAFSSSDLESLMPDQALKQIQASGIDLQKISQNAVQSEFSPQTLFELKEGNRQYKVWLE